jgi:hypothetical protein
MANGEHEMEDVGRRLKEIQASHGGRIHWHVSKHTAELAIEALEPRAKHATKPQGSGKRRRRKRHKRLL